MIPERRSRESVIEVLNYLLDQGVLKKESIDQMSGHFEYLESIFEKYKQKEVKQMVQYLMYLQDAIQKSIRELNWQDFFKPS